MFFPRLIDSLPQLTGLPLALLQEQPTEQAPAGMFDNMLVPFALIFAIFYFLMIRPEKKNRKKRENMLAELGKGAKVMTSGGLYGTVIQVKDQVVTLQIAEGVRVRYSLQ
ncbi:MAG: preprotein translocase subunit YajC, partial [Planctomycetota bacterium]|nr:preprotein translocase subunit YajC [Planctomycetota bacterium]